CRWFAVSESESDPSSSPSSSSSSSPSNSPSVPSSTSSSLRLLSLVGGLGCHTCPSTHPSPSSSSSLVVLLTLLSSPVPGVEDSPSSNPASPSCTCSSSIMIR